MPTRPLLVVTLIAWTWAAGARAQSVIHELDGPADAVLFGTAVDFAGDVDADGTSDVIVGDWLYSTYDGRARVYSGADGGLVQDIVGQQFGDRLGFSVSGAGDWNGDGRADLLVGVPQDECDCPNSGYARVVSGIDGATLFDFFAPDGHENWTGWSVARVGDVDRDGNADVLVGSPGWPFWATGTGRVALLAGGDGSEIGVFEGDDPTDFLGAAMAAAGDVDGDGVDDLVLGASQADTVNGSETGYVRVISGADLSTLLTIPGQVPGEWFGSAVAGPGDVDGDGHADLVVGATGPWYASTGTGRVAVHSGATGQLLYQLAGQQAGDLFGRDVAALGDVDNDGAGDFLVGAPGVDGADANAGRAIAVSGATGATIVAVDGSGASDRLGYAVGGGADVDADGVPDAVLGAPGPGSVSTDGRALVVSLVPAGLALYGAGTTGCDGRLRLQGNTVPAAGESGFALRCRNTPPSASGLIVVTDTQDLPGSDPFGLGVTLHVDVPGSSLLLILPVQSDADGYASLPLPIPGNPGLVGQTVYVQSVWQWGGACGMPLPGLSSSNGLSLTVQ